MYSSIHEMETNDSGASSSGKTVLAKHILSVLPSSTLIHQDDFAPVCLGEVPTSFKAE
jgi:hypothetical protein